MQLVSRVSSEPFCMRNSGVRMILLHFDRDRVNCEVCIFPSAAKFWIESSTVKTYE